MAENLNSNATDLLGKNINNREIAESVDNRESNKQASEDVIKLGNIMETPDISTRLFSRETRNEKIKRDNEIVTISYVREQYMCDQQDSNQRKDFKKDTAAGEENLFKTAYRYSQNISLKLNFRTLSAAFGIIIIAVYYQQFSFNLTRATPQEEIYTIKDVMTFLTVGFPDQKVEYCLMGLKSGKIPDSSITASSEYNANHGPRLGRLDSSNLPGFSAAWCAKTNVIGHWIQVDFGKIESILGIVTQGRADSDQWVKSFKVSCGNTADVMRTVVENGRESVFIGNKDRNSRSITVFRQVLTCRFIRVHPLEWSNHISMRLDFIRGACLPWFEKS